ncbi:Flap endonuclease 1 [Astathelohania contejeani]|uniref:Flap endonuclease 1 n=1 Tax=Astathelohania contejeani TaxID=164912 RepID=A0ABQ7HVW4_9MICR|nr:Flap endonuclease 1 [Thelohania contejeani]
MTIRGLENFEPYFPSSFQNIKINKLNKETVAIDGLWFIKRYIEKKPLSTILYGNKKDYKIVTKFLDFVKTNRIDILWIWSGKDVAKKETYKCFDSGVCDYMNMEDEKAFAKWNDCITAEEHVIAVTEILKSRNISVLRAPYSACAQIAYLTKLGICKYAFADTEFLLFDGGNVLITDFVGLEKEGKVEQIRIIKKDNLMYSLSLDYQRFRSFGMLLGCDFSNTVPCNDGIFDYIRILKIVRTYGSIHKEIELFVKSKFQNTNDNIIKIYLDEFRIGEMIINDHPIMTHDGVVDPIGGSASSDNIEKIFGQKKSLSYYHDLVKLKYIPNNFMQELGLKNILSDLTEKLECISIGRTDNPIKQISQDLGICTITTPRLSIISQVLILIFIVPLQKGTIEKILCLNNKMNGSGYINIKNNALKFWYRLKTAQMLIVEKIGRFIDMKDEDLNIGLFNSLICKIPFDKMDDLCIKNNIAFLYDVILCLNANKNIPHVENVISKVQRRIKSLKKCLK